MLSCLLLQPCVTCWERAGLLALLYVMFYCVFVTYPCDVLVLHKLLLFVIVLFPDRTRYFEPETGNATKVSGSRKAKCPR